ncbi:dihydrodipicolinate synthase family protein [Castellaniella sp.]|uniref:dihydrodipicolinate synthase family protein n=1 Tax=Castellaniella sp. TaxID=1955812 RepID=UPI002AFF7555|nr:dihydrodipicolinate synthase family protein [Castellaniella sp.]
MHWATLPDDTLAALRAGTVIPAHLLALDANRALDTRRQQALTRYYLDAGVGGLAVGVHSTQFAIRESGLYRPVLELAMRTVQDWTPLGGRRPLFMVAGLAGKTSQALNEARTARDLGYHAGLLSLAALSGASETELIEHCRAAAGVMPIMGFYLQPAVGGLFLSESFWQRFSEIDNVLAIKMAPFNRYRTLDVVRGVLAAKAQERIALYTGNDDHIVLDLLTPYTFVHEGQPVTVRICGGLLGHWSVWTERAVQLFQRIRNAARAQQIDAALLALDPQITDCNAALFDVAHDFRGCIAGCHEILRRQGLFEGIWCLDPHEGLSPGQAQALTRVHNDYPHLVDDAFVTKNLGRWLT